VRKELVDVRGEAGERAGRRRGQVDEEEHGTGMDPIKVRWNFPHIDKSEVLHRIEAISYFTRRYTICQM
jgi:hypothetical protein